MANIDLDDLDGPTKVPARTSRFAPKNSKVRLKAEPAPELDSQSPLVDSIVAKTEQESSLPSAAPAAVVKMDVEAKSEGEEANVDRMEEDDDGDIVFREIDVFFSPRIDSATQLYVLQYPLRPCWRPYELDERCEEVRVNPTSAEVEVDLSVDVDSQNYDADVDPRVRMIKQTLSSSMKPTRTSSYAVGVLIGNKHAFEIPAQDKQDALKD